MAIKDDPFIQEYIHRINKKIEAESKQIAEGKCSSFDEYKKRVGTVYGLKQSLTILDESIKMYMSDEEFDD